MRPLIAVTADVKHMEPYDWHATPSPYVDAVVDSADALPVVVPALGDRLDMETLLERVDGVLVTGSRSNVHPANYGAEPTPDHEPFDRDRDATTLPLIREAIARGMPLLAICRGVQELNVALGGTITAAFQKNRQITGHAYPWEGTLDERFELSHTIKIKDGSCLETVLGSSDPVDVNSLHTQALDRVAEGLDVEAWAPDGTIEAVSLRNAAGFVVGVQWHPEYWARASHRKDDTSVSIFRAFGEAARAFASNRSRTTIAAE